MSFVLGTIRRGLLTGCGLAAAARSSAWSGGDGFCDVRLSRVTTSGDLSEKLL